MSSSSVNSEEGAKGCRRRDDIGLFQRQKAALSEVLAATTRRFRKATPPIDDPPHSTDSKYSRSSQTSYIADQSSQIGTQPPSQAQSRSGATVQSQGRDSEQALQDFPSPNVDTLPRWRNERTLDGPPAHSDVDLLPRWRDQQVLHPSSGVDPLPRWRNEQVLDGPPTSDVDPLPRWRRDEQVLDGVLTADVDQLPRWRNEQLFGKPPSMEVDDQLPRWRNEQGNAIADVDPLPRWRAELPLDTEVMDEQGVRRHGRPRLGAQIAVAMPSGQQGLQDISHSNVDRNRQRESVLENITTSDVGQGLQMRTKGPGHTDQASRNADETAHEREERLGDSAVDAKQYEDAISHYTTALSLVTSSPQTILIRRSKAWLATGSWKQALEDANEVIALDPWSPCGYEMKHAIFCKAGDYDNAVGVLEVMLSKMAESPDPNVQRYNDQYVSPSSTRAEIRKIVQQTIRHSPHVLINTTTGYLRNKAEQASAFESLPIFNELVSSMKTRINYGRIKREVRQYFQYAMLSHKWEKHEPLFQQVIQISVYDLKKSPTHDKLQTFCKIVRDAGFKWAWSDTCCINKSDHSVLQEALVAMFRWYRDSAMMIVFLRGVRSSSRLGALASNIWNKRGWTLQEYVAAKIIRFYTEDWTPYLGLQLTNHKELPEVVWEMEQATGVSVQQLRALQPGLTSIREKLRLASTRETERVEDAAYSLLGIFSVTGMPAIYGEGDASLGRLLAHVLAGSGDVSILAWTGESGSVNSCLPAHITVFKKPATSHLPPPVLDSEMEGMITLPQRSFSIHSLNSVLGLSSRPSFDIELALKLYDHLNKLSVPWFAASRMKLPCIAFQIPPLSSHWTPSGRLYRADTDAFGKVVIKTKQDLSHLDSLYVVHPWLGALLGHDEMCTGLFTENVAPPSPKMDDTEESDEEVDEGREDSASLSELPPQPVDVKTEPLDRDTRARRLVVRLRQPFGPLLFAQYSTGRDYRRIAADCLINVRFQESVTLTDILENARILDVL